MARSKAMASLPRAVGRRLKSSTAQIFHQQTPTNPFPLDQYFSSDASRRLAKIGAFGLSVGAAQLYFGSAESFFDEKFVTYKQSEDLADFYGTE
jgi:hypothetical protein